MKSLFSFGFAFFFIASNALAADNVTNQSTPATKAVTWSKGMDIETFWLDYANSKGGLTWGTSTVYPDYEKVKEGDTLLIQLEPGPCLMEFFHSRWRRANDVRRWDDSINAYGGCPFVFD